MTQISRKAVLLAAAAALLPAGAAQAQWYSSASPPPLYPYAVQSPVNAGRPYAVEVAPNTYVIQRPARAPSARPRVINAPPEQAAPRFDRPPQKPDRALIEELRQRGNNKTTVINTTKIVREKPVVIETKRYVDDPPRVIERYHVAGDKKSTAKNKKLADSDKPKGNDDGKKRVINAEAEITILGPDRMSIRLFRRSGSSKANASVD